MVICAEVFRFMSRNPSRKNHLRVVNSNHDFLNLSSYEIFTALDDVKWIWCHWKPIFIGAPRPPPFPGSLVDLGQHNRTLKVSPCRPLLSSAPPAGTILQQGTLYVPSLKRPMSSLSFTRRPKVSATLEIDYNFSTMPASASPDWMNTSPRTPQNGSHCSLVIFISITSSACTHWTSSISRNWGYSDRKAQTRQ